MHPNHSCPKERADNKCISRALPLKKGARGQGHSAPGRPQRQAAAPEEAESFGGLGAPVVSQTRRSSASLSVAAVDSVAGEELGVLQLPAGPSHTSSSHTRLPGARPGGAASRSPAPTPAPPRGSALPAPASSPHAARRALPFPCAPSPAPSPSALAGADVDADSVLCSARLRQRRTPLAASSMGPAPGEPTRGDLSPPEIRAPRRAGHAGRAAEPQGPIL